MNDRTEGAGGQGDDAMTAAALRGEHTSGAERFGLRRLARILGGDDDDERTH